MPYVPLQPDKENASELQIQANAYLHLVNNYPELRGCIFHVPNGGFRSSTIEGNQLKSAGVVSGIPDLIIIWDGKFTYIEVKKPSEKSNPRGGCSENQINIHKLWWKHGFTGTVAYTSKEIVYYVLNFTNIPEKS